MFNLAISIESFFLMFSFIIAILFMQYDVILKIQIIRILI